MKKLMLKLLLIPVAATTWFGYMIIGLVIFDNWTEYNEEIIGFWGWYFS